MPGINEGLLRDFPSLVRNVMHEQARGVDAADEHVFNVLIPHTSEEKTEIVRPLVTASHDAGLSVWYDQFELCMGDSLSRKIDKGWANSRFGVVMLARAFLGCDWLEYEVAGLVTRSVSGEQGLLPV